MSFINYLEQYLELIPSFPFVIQVALYFIFINTLAIVIFVVSACIIRRNKRLADNLEQELYPKYIAFFNEILNSGETYTEEEVYTRYVDSFGKAGKLNKKTYPPLIATLEEMVKKNPHILSDKNYPNLVKGLKIESHLLKKLDFSNTRIRLRTFQTLSILDLTAPDSSILPYTHSRNAFIRKESRNSYIAISNNDPFKFFDQADNSLNYWDNISLMQQLEMHHKNNLPNFSKWIKYSRNKSQLLFVIKAVAHFNQASSGSALIEMLHTEDHDVRKEAIIALGEMSITEAEEPMIEMYRDQPQNCQNAIIEAVLSINSGRALDFLKSAYKEVGNLDSKKLIAEALYKYNDEGKAHIQELYHIEKGFNKLILDHIKNPLIPSRLRVGRKKQHKDSEYNYNSLGLNLSTT